MKGFSRDYPLFSLCGLKCGLCPMHYIEGGGCPGCGGGDGNQSCAIARCSLEHGGVEFCSQCPEYPCEKYDGLDDYDSFVPHRDRTAELLRVQALGIETYRAELDEKVKRLEHLLLEYNDGRRKSFFCTAVNVLDLADVRAVMEQIAAEASPEAMGLKERAAKAAALFQAMADRRGVSLKLTRKPKK